jgi:pimeloyl-ACP methyl ester carboxylesterase
MRLTLWQGTIQTEIAVFGEGSPVVWLHGPWGLAPDLKFLERVGASHRVYAPGFPGTTPGDPDGIHQLDSLYDLVVYHSELLDALGLETATLMGHSVGGMVACELAAAMPNRVDRLVVLDAVGLWRDDHPVKNWMTMPDDALRAALFANPNADAADAFFAQSPEPEPRADRIWALACTAKFIWPIPDKGLTRRMHRVNAPTLIVWGEKDGIASPAYAAEFSERLHDARVQRIKGAGHLPHLEQPGEVSAAVTQFLRES